LLALFNVEALWLGLVLPQSQQLNFVQHLAMQQFSSAIVDLPLDLYAWVQYFGSPIPVTIEKSHFI